MAGLFGSWASDAFSYCRNFAVIFSVNCQNPVRLAKIPSSQNYSFGSKIHTLSIWYLVFCIKYWRLNFNDKFLVGIKRKGFLFFAEGFDFVFMARSSGLFLNEEFVFTVSFNRNRIFNFNFGSTCRPYGKKSFKKCFAKLFFGSNRNLCPRRFNKLCHFGHINSDPIAVNPRQTQTAFPFKVTVVSFAGIFIRNFKFFFEFAVFAPFNFLLYLLFDI